MTRTVGAGLFALLLTMTGAAAQTPQERAVARDTVTAHGDSVVWVRASISIRGMPGRAESVEDTVQANGVVVDGTGLTVTGLSQIDPASLFLRAASGPSAQTANIKTEHSNLRIRLGNGQEVPAKIVLRDPDLDLAFVRPVDPPSTPFKAIDLAAAVSLKPADAVILLQRFGELTGWKPAVALGSVQAVVDKPRAFYVIAATSVGGGGLGSAVFDGAGKFVGILMLRGQPSSRRSPFAVMQGSEAMGLLPAVVPAADLVELVRQAAQEK